MNRRRKTRYIISGLLVVLTAAGFFPLMLIAVFYFGVFHPAVLARSFEKSGYYVRQCEAMGQKVKQHLELAGLPEELIELSQYRDALERKMRSQVFGRNDAVTELDKLNLAEDMLENLTEQGLETTLHSDQGILKLADSIGDLFEEETYIPGIVEWRQERRKFTQESSAAVMLLTALPIVSGSLLFLIQSKKYKGFYYLATSISLASAAGFILSIFLFRSGEMTAGNVGIIADHDMLAAEQYRKEVWLVAVKITMGLFLSGLTMLLCGRLLKKMPGDCNS